MIYDCFTFYNEFELLELRLKSLWDVVDRFVIVEANRKHNGQEKNFNFLARKEEFKEFLPKIKYVAADLLNVPFKGMGDWSIENTQRNKIMDGIRDASPDDLILISDADEIVAPDVLQVIRAGQGADSLEQSPLVMAQTLCYYYFDWVNEESWQGTILTKRKLLSTPQKLRNRRKYLPCVVGGGYHFSYMGGVDRVINKMTSIVEGNVLVAYSDGKLINRKHIAEALKNGTDIYNRQGTEYQLKPYDVRKINLPYLDKFLRKYPYFLHEPEKYFGGKFHG